MSSSFPTSLLRWVPGSPRDWVENYGGFVIASALSLVIATWLVLWRLEVIVLEIPKPSIRFILEPAPVVPLEPIMPAPVTVFENAATTVNPGETDVFNPDAQQGSGGEAEVPPDLPVTIATWKPKTEEERGRLAALEQSITSQKNSLNKQKTELEKKIMRSSIESAGKEFILNSDGGMAGIIRTIDVSGFPEDVTRSVLARYGITIEERFVTPTRDSRKFLNAASTSDGTYTGVQAEGYAEVFVCSAKAVSMMASLETTALMERNFDPAHSRIRSITFGIVMNSMGEYALGVTDLEVERTH